MPLLVLLLLGSAIACRSTETPEVAPLSSAIDSYLQPYVRSTNFCGTIIVVQGDRVLHHAGYGFADAGRSIPNGPDTRYRIASMTKSFTAAAVLLLAERGELSLDDAVTEFIPSFPFTGVTIEHLLAHTSGLPRYVFQPDYGDRERRPHSTRDLVDWVAGLEAVGPPGGDYAYSGANYSVLAHIIEQISGLEYAEFLTAGILDPLGLENTGDGMPPDGLSGLARGLNPVGIRDVEPGREHHYSVDAGSGSMYSSAVDLVAWLRARANGKLLSAATREEMVERAGNPFGYAWRVSDDAGRQVLSLQGWDGIGFGARALHFPGEDMTVVVLCNLNVSAIAGEVARNVAAIARGEPHEPLALLDRPADSAEVLARDLAGLYRFGDDFYVPGTTIEFTERDGQLIIPAEPPFPEGGLLPLEDGAFIHRQQWFRVEFERGADDVAHGIKYDRFVATRETAVEETDTP